MPNDWTLAIVCIVDLPQRQVELLDLGLEVAGRDHGAKDYEAVQYEDVRCARSRAP